MIVVFSCRVGFLVELIVILSSEVLVLFSSLLMLMLVSFEGISLKVVSVE